MRWMTTVAVATILSACGGGADTLPEAMCVDFSGNTDPSPGFVVTRKAVESRCCCVAIDLVATDLTDIHTVSLTLLYGSDLVEYRDLVVTSSILASDGAQVEVVEDSQPGRLTLGLSRIGSATGVDAVGSHVLATLYFTVGQNAGTDVLHVADGSVFGSETPPAAKPGLTWSGGTLVVR